MIVNATTQAPVITSRRGPRRALAWLAWALAVAAVVAGSEPVLFSVVIPAVAAAWLCLRHWWRSQQVLASGPVAVAAIIGGALLFTWADHVRAGGIRARTSCRLKQISMAFLNYSDAHQGAWPAPALYDSAGRPLLSWRVAILPFLEEDVLYKQFHLDEPWDSPHNLALLPRMPQIYAAANGEAEPYTTPFQAFVGPGTALEGPGLRFPRDFPDGTSNTILIVEARDTVPWTKPADLPYDPNGPVPVLGRVPFPRRLLFGVQRQQDVYPIVATVNGATPSLRPDISEAALRAAITRNGGEQLGPDW